MKIVIRWGETLVQTLQDPAYWWQVGCIFIALLLASAANKKLQKLISEQSQYDSGFRLLAVRSIQRLSWPLICLVLLLPAKAVLGAYELPNQLLKIAIPVLLALAIIRLCIYILRKAFGVSPLLKSSENLIAGFIWVAVILHLVGWLPPFLGFLDSMALTLGESRISILSVVKFLFVITVAFTLAIWLAELISRRVQASSNFSASMQVGFTKLSKFVFVTIAFLIALNAVGISLSSLAVFGGALGVGLGFGLQRIASNFISGFILVLDRSIKPGDVISVGDQTGWVEQLNARYVVVRNREGVDTLIPNENLITSEVINWSYSDRNVRVTVKVQISYEDNPEEAMALLLKCADASPRVLQEPKPIVHLAGFADSGIDLQLQIWIGDPENGTSGVKSDVNIAIWRAFKENKITIPYPQRDLHIKSGATLEKVPHPKSIE